MSRELGYPDLVARRALEEGDEKVDGVECSIYDDESLTEPITDMALDGAEDT